MNASNYFQTEHSAEYYSMLVLVTFEPFLFMERHLIILFYVGNDFWIDAFFNV